MNPSSRSRKSSVAPAAACTCHGLTFRSLQTDQPRRTGCPSTGAASPECRAFISLPPWLHKFKSALLNGVGEDAEYLAEHIAAQPSVPRSRKEHHFHRRAAQLKTTSPLERIPL